MTTTISAVFKTRTETEAALRDLEAVGVTEDQIGVIVTDETRGKTFKLENHSKSPQGVAAGATAGGIIGGILAAVAAAGTIVIPGLNLVVAGSLVAGLAGLGAGATAGGVIGGLVGLGVPEHEAKLHESQLRAGNVLLVVKARDHEQASAVRKALKANNASNIAA